MSKQFQATLRKLVDNEQYRERVKIDPHRITSDFQFTGAELSLLMALGRTADDASAAAARAGMVCASSSSSGGVSSDRRLKTGIEQVATLPSGICLYRFRYHWSNIEYVGVLAQDISKIAPHAVMKGRDGFLGVDYGALGLTMLPYAIWNARGGADGATRAVA